MTGCREAQNAQGGVWRPEAWSGRWESPVSPVASTERSAAHAAISSSHLWSTNVMPGPGDTAVTQTDSVLPAPFPPPLSARPKRGGPVHWPPDGRRKHVQVMIHLASEWSRSRGARRMENRWERWPRQGDSTRQTCSEDPKDLVCGAHVH